MERLFTYGTLQDTTVQMSLIGRELEGEASVLNGYIIHHTLMPPYPVAMPDENSRIEGMVYEVTEDELEKLDAYEGDCYLRLKIRLENEQDAWVYAGNPACYPDV